MSANPDPAPGADGEGAAVCPLCATPITSAEARCPSCGMDLAGVGGRPGPFSRATLWWWAAAMLLIYLVVLVIVTLVD